MPGKNNDLENKFLLEEPKLNLTVERKDLETYKFLKEPHYKQIDLKSYSIENAETVKSLYNEIENIILNQSESTVEVKPIDYSKILENVIFEKDEGNKIINVDVDAAIDKYSQIIFEIEESLRGLQQRDIESNKTLIDILDQKKKIMSNLALCYLRKKIYKEAIRIDLLILADDRKFEKSYLRLISCYTNLDSLDDANHYANLMKEIFGSNVVSKYPEYFNELERKNTISDQNLKKLSQRSKRVSEINSEIGDDDRNSKSKITDKKANKLAKPGDSSSSSYWNLFKLFFGGSMILLSSGFLFYLYKNKHRYQAK